MAVDKLVDSAQLDADLTSVANAIRTKGGTSAALAFPADFVTAINAISGGGGGSSGYELLASGSYTYSGSATGAINIPISYTGTPVWGYAVADEIIASTNQAYCFSVFLSGFPCANNYQNSRIGVVSPVNTSGAKQGTANNTTLDITSTQFKLSRANNTYLIQPNTYHWYIYGEAAT